jgi:hypothetical protein
LQNAVAQLWQKSDAGLEEPPPHPATTPTATIPNTPNRDDRFAFTRNTVAHVSAVVNLSGMI